MNRIQNCLAPETILLWAVLMVTSLISACGGPSSQSLKLDVARITPAFEEKLRLSPSDAHSRLFPAGTSITTEESNDTSIYTLTRPDRPIIYFTTLKECDSPARTPDEALRRQLFIGMKELRFEEKKRFSDETPPFVFSRVEGSLDNAEISFASFMSRTESCLTDVVYWSAAHGDDIFADEEVLIALTRTIIGQTGGAS